jgi:hypothetical protein
MSKDASSRFHLELPSLFFPFSFAVGESYAVFPFCYSALQVQRKILLLLLLLLSEYESYLPVLKQSCV